MPIECVWFDERPDDGRGWEPGWCFPLGYYLSRHYLDNVAQLRPAISVMLPGRDGHASPFCIDSHPTADPDGAWTVECPWPLAPGEKPLITVTPSIHAVGHYHGFLASGVLSDDLGG